MILPATYTSALLLLLLSFICLGSWPNLFRLTGTRWRFELFYFDFAVGALLLSSIAAFTFGTFGSDLAFSDRMLVAGRTAQVWAIAGGFVFNLGNMLLLAAMSLLGMSTAFPLSIGLALVVASLVNFKPGNVFLLVAGIVLMIPALMINGTASRFRDLPAAKATKAVRGAPQKMKMRKTTKGLAVGVVSGIVLGLFYPITAKGMAGDFGLGAYAGLLLFSVGVFISTVIFNFYFMNIAIQGEPLTFNAYFQGKPRQHFLGFAGGATWMLGALAAALATAPPAQTGITPALGLILPVASVLLVMGWGVFKWKEFAAAPGNAKISIGLTAALFASALVFFGLGIAGR